MRTPEPTRTKANPPAGNRFTILLLLGCAFILGCAAGTDVTEIDAQVAVEFSPNPPVVGANNVTILLTDTAGEPVRLGKIEVEGNMNHAGMKPVFTRLDELKPGRYSGTIEFTMGGDWFLLVTSEPTGDGRLNEKLDVRGVKMK